MDVLLAYLAANRGASPDILDSSPKFWGGMAVRRAVSVFPGRLIWSWGV
jgi:hypothetical protein